MDSAFERYVVKFTPLIKDNSVRSINRAIQKLNFEFGPDSVPTFGGLTLTGLTPTRLVYGNVDRKLSSVSNLGDWIAGTTNRITVTNDGDGTITLSVPQDIHTGASPTFSGLTIGVGTADVDYTLTFDGETNDCVITWMEDEDYLKFDDDLLLNSTENIYFRDTAIHINSGADGFLDIVADAAVRINSLVYGSMYNDNADFTVTIDTADTPVEVDGGFSVGGLNQVTFPDDHYLLIAQDGTYLITYSMSVLTSSVANKTVEGMIMIGGTRNAQGTSHAEVSPGGSNRPETLNGTAILTLSANDQVSLGLANHDDGTDLVVHHASLSLIRIGA